MTVAAPTGMSTDRDAAWAAYRGRVQGVTTQYAAIPAGQPVRLAKKTTNLFRPRVRASGPGSRRRGFRRRDRGRCRRPHAPTCRA